MLSRLFLCVLTLALLPIGSASARGDSGPVGPRVYLPLVLRQELPLSQVTGLAYSHYNWYNHTGPDAEIYTLAADGSRLTRLTDNDDQDEYPAWSPDRAYIAWQRTVGETKEAWIMTTAGAGARRILTNALTGAWSPVANRLLVREVNPDAAQGARGTLYVTAPADAAPTRVFGPTDLGGAGWSPAGDRIWFHTSRADYLYDLYLAQPDGSGARLLLSGIDYGVTWSPDGAWIAYQKSVNGQRDIFITRPDGSETRAVAASPTDELEPVWVEGGSRLVLRRAVATQNTASALLRYDVATGVTSVLLAPDPPRGLGGLEVAPDGRQVAYVERGPDDYALMRVALDGSEAAAISPRFANNVMTGLLFGGWSDDSRQAAYWRYWAFTPGSSNQWLYSADVGGATPTYRLLDELAFGPLWLPWSGWMSAATKFGTGLRVYQPATGAAFDLPASVDGTRLVVTEWRAPR